MDRWMDVCWLFRVTWKCWWFDINIKCKFNRKQNEIVSWIHPNDIHVRTHTHILAQREVGTNGEWDMERKRVNDFIISQVKLDGYNRKVIYSIWLCRCMSFNTWVLHKMTNPTNLINKKIFYEFVSVFISFFFFFVFDKRFCLLLCLRCICVPCEQFISTLFPFFFSPEFLFINNNVLCIPYLWS